MTDIEPTQFEERPVPVEIRNFGVRRNFKPVGKNNFRVVLEDDGKWYVFPVTPRPALTDADRAGIAKLSQEIGAINV